MKVELRFETFYYTPDGDWVMDDDWHKDPIITENSFNNCFASQTIWKTIKKLLKTLEKTKLNLRDKF